MLKFKFKEKRTKEKSNQNFRLNIIGISLQRN